MSIKYSFTEEVITIHYGFELRRIKAEKDFSDVKKGDLGGYIQTEDNLSHEGDAWVYDNAKVFDKAQVYGDAKIKNEAEVFDNAEVYGNAEVFDKAKVYGVAVVTDNAMVFNEAEVCGYTIMNNQAKAFNKAKVISDAVIEKKDDVKANNKDVVSLEKAQVFYDWLQGKEVKGFASKHQPHLSSDEAFAVLYFVQENLQIIPDIYERCGICHKLYNAENEGVRCGVEDGESIYCCKECENNLCK